MNIKNVYSTITSRSLRESVDWKKNGRRIVLFYSLSQYSRQGKAEANYAISPDPPLQNFQHDWQLLPLEHHKSITKKTPICG